MLFEVTQEMALDDIRVRDYMTAKPVAVGEDASLKQVSDLMTRKGIRHLPVVDSANQLVGLITQRDYLTIAISKLADVSSQEANELYSRIKVRDVMGRHVTTVNPDMPISGAARVMFERKFGCLPVIKDGLLVGILTEADFVKALIEPRGARRSFVTKKPRIKQALRRLRLIS